ncbi:MAG: 50S ribosomal protein L32 [Armatimonadetes bacterium]|nr:50S ribosomal protein L32 [Armatimonadota bacterium]
MPLPKRQHSHARTARRRAANFKLELPNVDTCPRCRAPKLPHHVCLSCGFYKNRMVLDVRSRARRRQDEDAESQDRTNTTSQE